MIDLTVVIPSYETRPLLVACLRSLERARRAHPDLTVEIIVVDNGSKDGSVEALRETFPDIRLFALLRNRGFAAAVNIGLRAARGRSVLWLNSDVEIAEDLLSRGVRVLDAHPEVGVVGAALRHPDGRAQRSVHALPSLRTELTPEFLRREPRLAYGVPPEGIDSDGLWEVEAVRGAVFFLRSSLVEKVGELDEGFFFFLEDTEYCARVARAGYRILHADGLRATHGLGASSKRRAPLATRIEFHRSLYRYFSIQAGPGAAAAVRILRMLRGAALVLGLALMRPFASHARERIPERWGLLLWHLRGCPETPRLADALDVRRVGESSG